MPEDDGYSLELPKSTRCSESSSARRGAVQSNPMLNGIQVIGDDTMSRWSGLLRIWSVESADHCGTVGQMVME